MATTLSFASAERNAALDAIRPNANSGFLRIYSGSVPTNADTALGAQVLLAELTLNATSFPAASGGVLTANAITGDTSADASGTASFFRIYRSNGTSVWCQGTVGTSGEALNLSTTTITATIAVNVTSLTVTWAA